MGALEWEWAQPHWIHLLWAVPGVLLVCGWGIVRRRRLLAVFGLDPARVARWLRSASVRRWVRAAVLACAFFLFAAAALQPRCDPKKTVLERRARDIAVIVDVSRSMLADDLKPNRLARAKLEIQRLSDRLSGDRVGLIAFSGDAVIKCPLTSNYSYFKSVVRNLSPKSAPHGGTKIGDAIRKGLRDLLGVETAPGAPSRDEGPRPGETVLEEEARRQVKSYADVLLITDGEDHGSYPLRAAESAKDANVGIYIVGLGSEEGTPIPVPVESGEVEYLRYKGDVVRSRLDSKTLMEVVNLAPRGAYLPAGTDNFDLVDFFENTLGKAEGRRVLEEQVTWTEVYQAFLLGGVLLYLLYLGVPERPRRHGSAELAPANPEEGQ